MRTFAPPSRHLLRRWAWLCVVAVLGFQSLGLIHRALHGGVPPVSRAALVAAADRAADAATPWAFGHLAGGADCQLLDQLSQALGPIVQAQAWTALLPLVPVSAPQPLDAPLLALWRHDARGPPAA